MQILFVYITAPDKAFASRLAEILVGERLCACANIIDSMQSYYWWNGRVEHADECVLICKTTDERYPAAEQRVRELHPYETPCMVAMPVTCGFAPTSNGLPTKQGVELCPSTSPDPWHMTGS